ncbi:hypothetical protein EPIB1_2498 [Tritonibacter mobilis]|nr:hypothetical protein EPIB1_2498 [Tritonibacter mobilis]
MQFSKGGGLQIRHFGLPSASAAGAVKSQHVNASFGIRHPRFCAGSACTL